MSISSVKTGAVGVSLLAGNTGYDPAATFLIQRVTATGGESSITFSAIPGIYKHLQIRILYRDTDTTGSAGTHSRLQFNSDSNANYVNHRLQGNGSTASAAGSTGDTASVIYYSGIRSGAAANIFGVGIVDIQDYTSTTKNKTIRYFSGVDANTVSTNYPVVLGSSLWLSSSAISTIVINKGFTSFAAGSTFALYGMVG